MRAAGVSRGALYHQFADKVELFAAVYESVEERLGQRVDDRISATGETDPLAMMRLGVEVWLDACAEPILDARQHAHGFQAVAANLEKVVVQANARNLQNLFPDSSQRLFERRSRS